MQVEEKKEKVCGYHYINTSHSTATDETSIINVDLSHVIEGTDNINLGHCTQPFTLKFTNTTSFDQVIRVGHHLRNQTEESIQAIYNKFNIVVEDTGSGKSTISYMNEDKFFENYLIAIIVREKDPVQGEAGKIVKKMVDIYSYHINTN